MQTSGQSRVAQRPPKPDGTLRGRREEPRPPAPNPCATMLPALRLPLALGVACAAFLPAGTPALHAQSADRIWGRVLTAEGDEYEGFLEFSRGQSAASWADVLAGSREISDDNYNAWLLAVHDGRPAVRTVDVRGYRVSWEERYRDFATETRTGIRFGHLAALVQDDEGGIEAVRRGAGDAVTVDVPGSRTGGVSVSPGGVRTTSTTGGLRARVTVDTPGEEQVVVSGRVIERIEFGASPPGAVPSTARVHGSVEDRFGRTFTGFISWSGAPVLQSDRFLGRDDDGDLRRFPFAEISAVESRFGGAWVTLASGEGFDLYRPLGSRYRQSDIRWYRRTIRIADPGLGTVEVEWDDLHALRLHPPSVGIGYDDFGETGSLYGVVTSRSGEGFEGWIRWDADEEWTWDQLNGRSDNVEFDVEFGRIRQIVQSEDGHVRVTLLDGRNYELSDSNDVGGDNRGIFVFPNAGPLEREGVGQEGTDWHHIAWEDFGEARFRAAPEGAGS